MAETPRFKLAGTALATRDARALAAFYERLLGWQRHAPRAGARDADFQPQPDVRVTLDPDGQPFCRFESAKS